FKGNVYVNGNITTQGGAKFGKNVYTNGSFKANGNAVEIRGDLISSSSAADFYFGLNQYNKYVTAKNVHINGRIQSGSSEPALTGGTFLQNQNLPVRAEPTNLTS